MAKLEKKVRLEEKLHKHALKAMISGLIPQKAPKVHPGNGEMLEEKFLLFVIMK